jgi:dipeptidyl aminopeptidase/acylaminoacyl peptidase
MFKTLIYLFLFTAIILLTAINHGVKAEESKPKKKIISRVDEVFFKDGKTNLHGALVIPNTSGPHPVVVFVHGSGPADCTGYNSYFPLWEYFASCGFACLSWDKPGVGESKGDWSQQSFKDRANEVLSAIQFLKSRNDIDSKRIGLWGISQGGWILPLAASMSKDVAFIIPVSGPGISPKEQGIYTMENQLKADGFSAEDIARAKDFRVLFDKLAQDDASVQKLSELIDKFKDDAWFKFLSQAVDDWEKSFAFAKKIAQENYEPIPVLEKVKCPVLAIWGELDMLVPAQKSKEIFEKALKKSENKDLTLKIFPNADHNLTLTKTGGWKEQAENLRNGKLQLAPGYFELMGDWLKKRFVNKEEGKKLTEENNSEKELNVKKVSFKNGETILSGVLVPSTATNMKGPYPAIIFVHGSGSSDASGYGSYMPIFKYFSSLGFVCMSWDKPGCGESTGDWGEQDFTDRANEVLAAIQFLKTFKAIDPKRIGLWGSSQGGWILPLAASMSNDVNFIIPVSGPGITPKEQYIYSMEHMFKNSGLSDEEIKKAKDFMSTYDKLVLEDAPNQKLLELIDKFKNDDWFKNLSQAIGDWEKTFKFSKKMAKVNYDPVAVLEKVKCPVLSIWGELDIFVPAQKSKEIFEKALKKAGNKDVTLKIFPGADHGISMKATGKLADGFLQTMGDWLKKRFGNKEKSENK